MRTIRQTTPSSFTAFKALIRSDLLVQVRQRRSFIASLLVPLLFLFTMKRLIPVLGPAAVLATSISIGLPAIGLMGYALAVSYTHLQCVCQRSQHHLRSMPSDGAWD